MRGVSLLRAAGAVALALIAGLTGCGKSPEPSVYAALVISETEEPRVTQESFVKIADGMTQEEVREIFGNPFAPSIGNPELGEIYELSWEQANSRIRVRIRDGRVIGKWIEEIQ
ncbi:MAG TPA: hypothetical protein VMN36_16300 [Verrucomicrobiales bacterium]|nr:hypothetical protein [Verrucomicrobiales bacterium]